MKRLLACSLICLLGSPLIASCGSADLRAAPEPAVLTQDAAPCSAQLNHAASELLGRALTLTHDAFAHNDAVVLSTVGQSASGRMLPPTQILRLELAPQGCQLRLEGRARTLALPHCSCRPAGR